MFTYPISSQSCFLHADFIQVNSGSAETDSVTAQVVDIFLSASASQENIYNSKSDVAGVLYGRPAWGAPETRDPRHFYCKFHNLDGSRSTKIALKSTTQTLPKPQARKRSLKAICQRECGEAQDRTLTEQVARKASRLHLRSSITSAMHLTSGIGTVTVS